MKWLTSRNESARLGLQNLVAKRLDLYGGLGWEFARMEMDGSPSKAFAKMEDFGRFILSKSKEVDTTNQAIVDSKTNVKTLFYSSDPNFPFTDFAFWQNDRLVLIQVSVSLSKKTHNKDFETFERMLVDKLKINKVTPIDMYYVYEYDHANDLVSKNSN